MHFYDVEGDYKKQYDMGKFLPFVTGFSDVLQSYFFENLRSIPAQGKWQIQNGAGDPQLISYEIYGDTQYWWLLMAFNDVVSLDELTVGRVLVYPSLSEMTSLFFDLKARERLLGYLVEE